MVTESFQEYKDYTIRLRAVTGGGFGYSIIKKTPNPSSPNGMKNIYLRTTYYNFISSERLLSKAKNYIDNFEDKLIEKFERTKNTEIVKGNPILPLLSIMSNLKKET